MTRLEGEILPDIQSFQSLIGIAVYAQSNQSESHIVLQTHLITLVDNEVVLTEYRSGHAETDPAIVQGGWLSE